MYLTASRPDIMFAVYACSRFQVTPKTSHLHAVKRIFRYLKGKPKLGLWYPNVSSFNLEAHSDSDYAGANLDRKSTTRGCQFLGRRLISWQCNKQTIVATSTTEAEYVAVGNSQTVNDEKQIHAIVNSKAVVITEASIRSSFLFNDADGTDCLTNEAIFQNLALMGYEGALNKLTFQKALFSPQWKYLIHTILDCLSSKSTSWNEFSTNIASAVICLTTNQKFNFSKLIFDGMLRNLDNPKKKFLMYPRFLMVFLNNQIEIGEPFNDVYITPAHNLKVFSNMLRKGLKFSGKIIPLFPNMLTQAVVDEGEGSEQPTEPQPTPSFTQPSTGDQPPLSKSLSRPEYTDSPSINLEGTGGSHGDQVQTLHDSPLSGGHTSDRFEDALNLEELFSICTNLSNRVLALETVKDAQATEILKLRTRIKKLEKKCKPSISHHRAWLRSVSIKKKLRKKEYVSKQGRKKAKPGPTLDDSTLDDLDLDLDHSMDYIETEEAVDEGRLSKETEELKLTADTEEIAKDKGSGEKGGSTKELVSTAVPEIVSTTRSDVDAARQEVSAVEPRTPPATTSIFDDEDITMAQTLIKMKEKKAKEKGVAIKEVKESDRLARSILTLKPLPTIDPKDKGKGVLKESPVKKVKRSDLDAAQIAKDAEVARLEYERKLARMDASEELAARLQMEEREMYSVEERSRLLAELIFENRKKQLAAERSAAVRNKPPTRTQLRSLMMTYLKHTGRRIAYFVPIGLERDERMIEKLNKKAAGMDEKEALKEPNNTKVEENTRKRPGRRLKMKATKKSKRQKIDSDLEDEEQLKAFLKIVPDEEREIDYEVLDKRYPIINWESKFYHTDRYGEPHDYYRVFRSDGSSRWIKFFFEMVTRFNRMDLEELYNLVMKRFKTTTPEDDDLYKNQEEWILKSWNFYDNCGVHILMLEDGTEFYMLAERGYPLTKETLKRMLALRLIAESKSEATFDLLRFIQKQIDESGSHDGNLQELTSPVQTAPALAIPEQTAIVSLDLSRLATTLNRLERSIQIGINNLPQRSSIVRSLWKEFKIGLATGKTNFFPLWVACNLFNLISMHICWSSVFILPTRIILDNEQLMRGFLWCQGDMWRGKAKVSWEAICLPKHEGVRYSEA
ncbi:hypothetical protein Tco_0887098 [Tanacetum coccineum]